MLLSWTIIMLEYMYIPLYLLDLGMAPNYHLSSTLFKYLQILLPNIVYFYLTPVRLWFVDCLLLIMFVCLYVC